MQNQTFNQAEYKARVRELSAEWKRMPDEEKAAFQVEAAYQQGLLDDLAQTPLPTKDQTDEKKANVWRNGAKKLSAKRLLQASGRWLAPSPPISFPPKRLGNDYVTMCFFFLLLGYPMSQSVDLTSRFPRTRREPAPRRKLRLRDNNDLNMRKNERSEKFQDGTCSNGTKCRIKLLTKLNTKQEFVN